MERLVPITAVYAGLLAIVLFVLSLRVIGVRRQAKVAVGDQGNATLLRRMRAHANFAEYVPYCLVLMGLAESLRAPPLVLHGLGAALLVGRLLHAYGISQTNEKLWLRVTGMAITFTVLLTGALLSLALAIPRLPVL